MVAQLKRPTSATTRAHSSPRAAASRCRTRPIWIMRQAGPLSAGVSRAAREGGLRVADAHAGSGGGSDPAAAASLRARCRDSVQRHHDAAAGHGRRRSTSSQVRSCASRFAPTRRSMRCPQLVPERDVPFVLEIDPPRARERAARRAAHRIRGRARSRCSVTSSAAGPRRSSVPRARSCTRSREAAERLLDKLADAMAAYLRAQAAGRRAGPDAVRILGGPARAARIPALRACARCSARCGAAHAGVPLIYYANQGAALHGSVATLDVDVVGVDWRTPLERGPPHAREPTRPCRAISIRRRCLPRPRSSSATPMRCCAKRAPRPGISSTSATASGRRPTRTPSRGWSTTCMSATRMSRAHLAAAPFPRLQHYLPRPAGSAFARVRVASNPAQRFETRQWQRPKAIACKAAARCALMRGEVFEKVGVNVSHVWGELAPQAARPGPGRGGVRRPLRRLRASRSSRTCAIPTCRPCT